MNISFYIQKHDRSTDNAYNIVAFWYPIKASLEIHVIAINKCACLNKLIFDYVTFIRQHANICIS